MREGRGPRPSRSWELDAAGDRAGTAAGPSLDRSWAIAGTQEDAEGEPGANLPQLGRPIKEALATPARTRSGFVTEARGQNSWTAKVSSSHGGDGRLIRKKEGKEEPGTEAQIIMEIAGLLPHAPTPLRHGNALIAIQIILETRGRCPGETPANGRGRYVSGWQKRLESIPDCL